MASGHGHGRMSISMKFIRLLIVLFNLAFILVGLALLAIGVYVVKDPKMQQLRPLLNPDLTSAYSQSLSYIEIFAIAIIVIGGVLLVIGFLGCCGAIKGFRFLHVLYAIIIGAIIIAEIAIVVAFIAYQNQFRSQLVTKLRQSITTYYVGIPINNSTTVNPVSLSWDFAQFNLQCCGAISNNDFASAANWDRTDPYTPGVNLTVPFTCCPVAGAAQSWTDLPANFSSAQLCAATGTGSYSQGCYDRLLVIITTYKNNFIIGVIVVGVVELLAFIFAIVLYCRKQDYNSL
jgi:tetraspanin-18